MAFNSSNFVNNGTVDPALNDGNERRFSFTYTTTDNISDITEHYFDAKAGVLRKGDLISVEANDGKAVFVSSTSAPSYTSVVKYWG